LGCSIGVYKIYNNQTGRVYIGSSCRIEYRWTDHKRSLKNHCHANYLMQQDYEKYGMDSFEFSIVEVCDDDSKLEREKYYAEEVYDCLNIDGKNSKGYNLAPYLNVDFAVKQHVPHKIMCENDIELSKILLSIGVPVNSVSLIMKSQHTNIKLIKSLYNFKDLYSFYNPYMQDPNSSNLFEFDADSFFRLLYWKFKMDGNRMFKHIPVFDLKYLSSIDNDDMISLSRSYTNTINNFNILKYYYDLAHSIKNQLSIKIFFFAIAKSVASNDYLLSYFSMVEFVSELNLKITYHDYISAINYLVNFRFIEIDNNLKCIKIPYAYIPKDVFYKLCAISDIDLLSNAILYDNDKQHGCMVGFCKKCGRIFKQNKSNNAKFCLNHRGYQKKLVQHITCIDCGVQFEVGSKSRRKIRCDSCLASYMKKYKKEYYINHK